MTLASVIAADANSDGLFFSESDFAQSAAALSPAGVTTTGLKVLVDEVRGPINSDVEQVGETLNQDVRTATVYVSADAYVPERGTVFTVAGTDVWIVRSKPQNDRGIWRSDCRFVERKKLNERRQIPR